MAPSDFKSACVGKAVTPFPAIEYRQCLWSTHGRKCEDTKGEAEEREKVNKEAREEECKRVKRKFLGKRGGCGL